MCPRRNAETSVSFLFVENSAWVKISSTNQALRIVENDARNGIDFALFVFCHARAWPEHPRVSFLKNKNSWMVGLRRP
jgi:hypothetical protein